MPPQVFISYKSQDRATTESACAALEATGVSCWLAPRDVPPGADYKVMIPEAINAASLLLLIFSSSANGSRHVLAEVQLAFNNAMPIIPLRIEDSSPTGAMKYLLSHSQWFDAFSPSPIQPHHIEQLVNIINQHLNASPADSPPSAAVRPSAAPNCGAQLYKFCDRDSQENKFIEQFNKYRKEQPGRPQLYFIHGEDGECHDSFVERLMHGPVREIAEKTWGEQHGVITYKRLDWPHEDEIEPELQLKAKLFKAFDYGEIVGVGELSAIALSRLVADQRCPLVIIQHNIHARHWGERTRRQIDWYMRYWAEMRGGNDVTQFLIFLSVIYPGTNKTRSKAHSWWWPWQTASRNKTRVQAELAEIVAARSAGHPCFVLKELTPPKQFEVQDWFSRYQIYDEQTQREKLAELFPAQVQHLSMSQVQRALKKIHEEFVHERGSF